MATFDLGGPSSLPVVLQTELNPSAAAALGLCWLPNRCRTCAQWPCHLQPASEGTIEMNAPPVAMHAPGPEGAPLPSLAVSVYSPRFCATIKHTSALTRASAALQRTAKSTINGWLTTSGRCGTTPSQGRCSRDGRRCKARRRAQRSCWSRRAPSPGAWAVPERIRAHSVCARHLPCCSHAAAPHHNAHSSCKPSQGCVHAGCGRCKWCPSNGRVP